MNKYIIPESRSYETPENPEAIKFVLLFPEGLPKGTAQQKGETSIRGKDGRFYVVHYKKTAVQKARRIFISKLEEFKPSSPFFGAVELKVSFTFSIKKKSLWGKYKDTRPDTDNYLKEFKDCLQACGYFYEDAQVAREIIEKKFGEVAKIKVELRALGG